ncbi:MAG: sugar transferase [Candidatus Blackburnbacteria bacterium]|nr:sugar transferase [Candidatus Blackburnbacteria bacterium]
MDYIIIKRILDIFLALFLLVLFLPIMLTAAALIKLTSPGPVFADMPKRAGKRGKPFRLYKFRSMIPGAYNVIRKNPEYKKLFQEYQKSGYKLYQDPRITPMGHFIRKYSIDEMPQLMNVLRGEMSLVGPRPYFPKELEEQQRRYPGTGYLIKEALSVKPGITGIWQVSGRSNINFDKRIALDAYYARRNSLFLDFKILLKTPWAMIRGKGAV